MLKDFKLEGCLMKKLRMSGNPPDLEVGSENKVHDI